ncbi:hypothetical protein LQZ18_01565 [Lachnospiraceae bacterium ZAX-1]
MHKNNEGYADATAGEALRSERIRKSKERRLEEMQKREDFDVIVRAIREIVEQGGFSFTRDIWLIDMKTDKIYREFERR